MQRYPAHFVAKVRRLASSGLDYKEISQKLNISKQLISVWCNGLNTRSHKSTIQTHQKQRNILINSELEIFNTITFDRINARLFCGLLYGCEGSKYPASNCIALTNADPELIRSFTTLFRKSFDLKEEKWRVHLQIHDNQNYEKLVSYWSDLLNIPKFKFIKPTITKPKGKKHRDRYLGTCTVKYYDYKLQLKLIGIFQEFMRKSRLIGGVA